MNLRGTLSALWVAALALALLLGAWLRLSGLGQQSLWADELFSADLILNRALQPAPGQPWLRHVPFAELQPGDTFWTVKGADQSPPLFELAAKLCVRLLGDGEAALRVASALPAVLALLWLAWGAWQRRAAAAGVAWAALLGLTASSWLLAAYAQEARAYSLGAALLLPLIVRFAQRAAGGWTHAAPPGWGEALLAAAACLTHYNAAAVVVLLWAVYGALALRRHDAAALVRLAAAPLALAAWLWVAQAGFAAAHQGEIGWIAPLGWGQALALLVRELGANALGWPAAAALAAVCALALGAWGWQAAAARRAPCPVPAAPLHAHGRALLALLALALAAFALLAHTTAASRIWNVRHLIFLLPVLYAATAAALALLAARWQILAWILAAMLCAAQLPMLRHLPIEKNDFRQAAAAVLARLHDGDIVLLGNTNNTAGDFSYYLGARSGRQMQLRELGSAHQAAETCRRLADARAARVGIVSHPFHSETLQVVEQHCAANYNIEAIPISSALARILSLRAQH